MSSEPDSSSRSTSPPPSLWKRDGWPVVGIAIATVAVQLGVFLVPQAFGAGVRTLIPASLIIAGVWVAMASAVFAAEPESPLSGLLRGGCVGDSTAVLLLVLWAQAPEVTFLAACKLYCIYASVSLCAVAIVRTARTVRFRYLSAVVGATLLTALQGGLFWLPGLLQLSPTEYKSAIAGIGLRANPLYGVFSAIADESGFVWHYAELMYRITPLGEDIAVRPVQWYEPMAIHLAAAGAIAILCLLRGRLGRGQQASAAM